MPVIEVRNVTKIFGKDPQRALALLKKGKTKEEILRETGMTVGVNQVSFAIEKGEIFVIMGLSGSGKSTLVRLLNRLIEPSQGEVLIHGRDIVRMDKRQLLEVRRKHISMVFQKFALFPHRTVAENVEYGLEVQGVAKDARRAKALQALELVGLGEYADKYPSELSGGMQQRVGLARALANDPDILLMDEAFSALDPLIRKDMQDELLELHQSVGKTIVFITHDLDEALRIGDRIALMRNGSIVQIGTPEEILMEPANDYVKRFVEDVNLAKVLTAKHIMKRAESVTPDKGPRVALEMMRERGISAIYVIDKKRTLLGVLSAEQASRAVTENQTIEAAMTRDVSTVGLNTLLTDLFESAASGPLAVVDDQNRLQGIVVKGAILGAMAGDDKFINGNGVMEIG
jgi:glycine betaine/proline transport system ATP-binding protein